MKNLQIKKHLLTGISFMLPLVVSAGLCIAIGQIIPRFGIETKVSDVLVNLGVYGMNLLVPVFCASIAYSIADKPGIAPGLVLGYLANEIKAGFLGGILFGFVVGFVVLWLKKNLKVPKYMWIRSIFYCRNTNCGFTKLLIRFFNKFRWKGEIFNWSYFRRNGWIRFWRTSQ